MRDKLVDCNYECSLGPWVAANFFNYLRIHPNKSLLKTLITPGVWQIMSLFWIDVRILWSRTSNDKCVKT